MPKPTVAQVRLIVAILERGGTDVPGVDLFHYRRGIKAATSTIESCKRHGWITRDEQANWTVALKGRADAANCFTTYPTPVDLAVTRGELKSAPLVRGNETPASLLRQPAPGVEPEDVAEQAEHVVVIDSPQRIKAVAWLARRYRHAGARTALRGLAVAVGVECRGGRIYPQSGWSNFLAHGWDRFIERLSYADSDIRWLAGRMADHGAKTGATLTIEAGLAEEIRGFRVIARERTITEATAAAEPQPTADRQPGEVAEERCPDPECGEPLTDIAAGRVGHCGRNCAPITDPDPVAVNPFNCPAGYANCTGAPFPGHVEHEPAPTTDSDGVATPGGDPKFPVGTPEHEAYRLELQAELGRWSHGETPVDPNAGRKLGDISTAEWRAAAGLTTAPSRRWVIAGLATAEATTDTEPTCPLCAGMGQPTQPAPHLHHLPTDAAEATARVFVFDVYEA